MQKQLTVLNTVLDLARVVSTYRKRGTTYVAFDTETTGLSHLDDCLVSLQFMQFGQEPLILDVRHWTEEDFVEAGAYLQELFDNHIMVGMNLSFDYKLVVAWTGAKIGRCYDVMLAEQVLQGLGKSSGRARGIEFNLAAIASRYGIPVSKAARETFIRMNERPEEWNAPFTDELVRYMAQDVEVLEKIMARQEMHDQFGAVIDVIQLENRTMAPTASIEFNGIHVNRTSWMSVIREKEREAKELEAEAIDVFGEAIAVARAKQFKREMRAYNQWEKALAAKQEEIQAAWAAQGEERGWGVYKNERLKGWRALNPNPGRPKNDCYEPINLGSPAQLLLAFGEMKIPLTSTSKDAIADLPEGVYPQVDLLKKWREANMFPVKFGEKLLAAIHPRTGRLYPNIQQIGADTGRMSVSNPPWQQVPSKTEAGKRLRAAVVAEPGNVLLTSDYPNIELRILAELSRDATMLRLFAEGKDLHAETARMMFHLSADVDVKHTLVPGTNVAYRDLAKTINFGLIYGMSAAKLARTLKITKVEAQELMERYFSIYPGVVRWLNRQKVWGVSQLYSKTILGRRRFYSLPHRYHEDYNKLRSYVERQACNSPIQGASADITKLALCLAYERLPECARIVAVVHDEIVVECPEARATECSKILAQSMKESCTALLHEVFIPDFDVVISDHWSKE